MKIAMLVLNDMRNDARVSREARTLALAGHSVEVLALRSSSAEGIESRDGYTIRRVADATTASLRQPLRKYRQRRTREAGMRAAAIAGAPDTIHCHDTNTLGIGASAARALGIPYVYDAHELYPDSLMQRPFQRSALVQGYLRRLERRLVPGAAAVITVSDGLAEVLRERYGVDPVVVTNSPELKPVADRSLLKRELGLAPDTVVALYQGGVMIGRAVDELVDAVARVPGLHLVVQGTGEYEPAMRARVADRGIEGRVTFMGHVPYERLFDLTCGADIGTVFLDGVTLNHKLAWTNRMFVYLMAGIPIAATDLPGAAAVIGPSEAGLLAPPGDVDAMTDVLVRLASDPELRDRMGERGRRLAEERFNWQHEEQKLLAVYERVSGRTS